MEVTDNRKVSICIATRNRFEAVIASFKNVIDDSRVEEFVICDDQSEEIFYWKLMDWLQFDAPEGKIKLCQNEMSLGSSLNKQRAVIFADSEYIILLDPTKVLTTTDLDYIFQSEFHEDVISQFLWGEFANRAAWLSRFDAEQKMLG